MKWFYNRMYKKEKGFTLVELMVVIIILAVLTGIAVPSYLALRNRAREQATRSEMLNIGTAIAIYEADRSALPATGMTNLITALEGTDSTGSGAYMASVPTHDAWGTDDTANGYVYLVTGTSYSLTSKAGTTAITDDIVLTDGQLN